MVTTSQLTGANFRAENTRMNTWQKIDAENLVRHKSGSYYLSAKVHGKKMRKSLQTKSLRIAKIKRDEMLKVLRAGEIHAGEKIESLRDVLQSLDFSFKNNPSLKPRTVQYYETILDILERTLPVEKSPKVLTPGFLKKWWMGICENYHSTRANNTLSMMKKICKFLMKKGSLITDPSEDLKRVKVQLKDLTVPTREEFGQLVEEVRRQNRRFSEEAANQIEFMAYSGLRHGELMSLRWDEIDSDSILVTGGEGGTKNSEKRYVPIVEPLKVLISKIKSNDDSGLVFSTRSVRKALANACERLGLPHMRIHDLRHLFATTCIESGVDIPTVSKWLGHKDGGALAMRVYGHLRDEHSRQQAAKVKF